MNAIQDAIKEIVEKIPKEKIFDSHYVIDELRAKYPDEYSGFASSANDAQKHGLIAQKIEQTLLVDKVGKTGESWSINSHDNASECTEWKRK